MHRNVELKIPEGAKALEIGGCDESEYLWCWPLRNEGGSIVHSVSACSEVWQGVGDL